MRDVATALAATGTAVLVGTVLTAFLELPSLSMVFLVAVLACAVSLGIRAAVLAAFLSFLAYNFFFIDPLYPLTVARPDELLSLLIFLIVAVLTGSLTGRVREQAQSALRRSRATQALFEFSRKLSAASTAEEVLWATVTQVHTLLGGKAILLMPSEDELQALAAWPPDELIDPSEQAAARWALEKAEVAGWRTGTLPNVRYRFEPLSTPRRVVAVLGYQPADTANPPDPRG